MLGAADRQQGFLDAVWCRELLPEDSIYELLSEHGERIVRDEDFAECYSERQGRPSIPPSLLAKVLLLAYRDGLSDERAMDAVRFDLRWKVALDLPIDHPGFHSTSLVRFRARLLLHGKERLVFERSVGLAAELGLISGESEQILDSTPMLGAAAVHDTAVLVRAAVRKLIDAVKATDEQAASELRQGLRFDHSRPRERPEGDWRDRDARMQLLSEVAVDAERALRAVENEAGLMTVDRIAEAAGLLREILGQEFAVDDDQVPRLRTGRRGRKILSADDPEMRRGHQTAQRRFDGYKIHAAADAEVPIVTAVTVTPGNESDGPHAGALIDQQPEQLRPQRVLADTAYGNVEVREQLEQREVDVLARVHSTSPKDGMLPKDAFQIDLENDTVTCPQGHTVPIHKPKPNRKQRGSRARSGSGPPTSPARTASPARSSRAAPRAPIARSASDAARTYARPRCRCYPTPTSSAISITPGRASSGCLDSSSTATKAARAATSEHENLSSRPSGPPYWSTSTQSEQSSEPRRHNGNQPQAQTTTTAENGPAEDADSSTTFSAVSDQRPGIDAPDGSGCFRSGSQIGAERAA